MRSTSIPATVDAATIDAALARGATVVTATDRAARSLQRRLDLRHRELGETSWQPAAVMTWQVWTHALWQAEVLKGDGVWAQHLLLSQTQELELWRRVIGEDRSAGELRGVDSLATLAQETFRTLCRYNGLRKLRGTANTTDTRAFQRWLLAFERECSDQRLLPGARLEEVLSQTSPIRFTGVELALLGFDGFTPAQRSLVDFAELSGAKVEFIEKREIAEDLTLVEAASNADELQTAALWIAERHRLNPREQIALVVPDLDSRRPAIERAFAVAMRDDLPGAGQAIEYSLGRPLREIGYAAGALDLLRWTFGPLPLERVTSLLLSGHLDSGGTERDAAAEFDAVTLRHARLLRPEITLVEFQELTAHGPWPQRLPELRRRLARLARTVGGTGVGALSRRSHPDWTGVMHELLQAAGWGEALHPDARPSSEIARMLQQRWNDALDELATLGIDGIVVPFDDALRALEGICSRMIFATPSTYAPIQVMGVLESAGSDFDVTWLLGAGEFSWPGRTARTPLLSRQLQRELGMPGTDLERDAEEAKTLTRRLAASAAQVIFSYPILVEGDGEAVSRQRVSPVLASLELEPVSSADWVRNVPQKQPVLLERFDDAAAVPPPPPGVIRGGSAVLRSQAACGFNAFAERRLGATMPDTVGFGLNALENGSLVHQVLERFWSVVQDQPTLRGMTADERRLLLQQAIKDSLHHERISPAEGWDKAYIDVQRERLVRLLSRWLEHELERPPFEVIQQEQVVREAQIGPLTISMRVDRVDRVYGADGSDQGLMIIDYKTGVAKTAHWEGERPDEPQLPLYAVTAGTDELAGIAFGQIRPGKGIALNGYADKEGLLKNRPNQKGPAFAERLEEWRRVLTQLAEQFYGSDASVSPKEYPLTCNHCQQRLICRLNPAMLDEEAEEEREDLNG